MPSVEPTSIETASPSASPAGAPPSLNVVLVEPEIAENTGSVGRTCVAVGARLWLVRPLGFHLDDRRRRRAALDYWDRLDWQVRDNPHALVDQFGPDRVWLFSTKGTRVYHDAAFQAGDALFFGSESKGLPQTLRDRLAERVLRIPMRDPSRSLNLAVSVGVAVYEAIRQIGLTPTS